MGALRFVFEMFRAHKIRFMLTISGVVVGVASMVILASLLAVGEGVLRTSSARASGDDVVTISNDWRSMDRNPDEKRLDYDDKAALERSALTGDLADYTAVYGMDPVNLKRGQDTDNPLSVGVEPSAFGVHNLEAEKGRLFTRAEYEGFERVTVVGAEVLKDHGGVKVGETLYLGGRPYTVVGILAKKASMGPGKRWSWNARVIIPARMYAVDFNPQREPSQIVAQVTPPAVWEGTVKSFVLASRDMMSMVLMTMRQVDNFDFGGVSDDNSTENTIEMTIKILIFMTTVFSMVVGGINIMNIMLVTVTERTREIGVRRALGATQRDILKQFLSETVGITLTGAAMGTAVALGILYVASLALTKFVAPWPFYVAPWSLATSLGFSILIGVVFGISPAWRASRLHPVEALRYE